jgi:hypothetical protein
VPQSKSCARYKQQQVPIASLPRLCLLLLPLLWLAAVSYCTIMGSVMSQPQSLLHPMWLCLLLLLLTWHQSHTLATAAGICDLPAPGDDPVKTTACSTGCRVCYELSKTMAKKDRPCICCKAGYVLNDTEDVARCDACEIGWYAPAAGSIECSACLRGTTTTAKASNTCNGALLMRCTIEWLELKLYNTVCNTASYSGDAIALTTSYHQ